MLDNYIGKLPTDLVYFKMWKENLKDVFEEMSWIKHKFDILFNDKHVHEIQNLLKNHVLLYEEFFSDQYQIKSLTPYGILSGSLPRFKIVSYTAGMNANDWKKEED